MTQSKINATAALLSGSPELLENKAAVAMVPGSLAVLSSGGLLTTPSSGQVWSGEILVDMNELGQGYSGVFATDSAAGRLAAASSPVRYAVVDMNEDFYAYALAGKGDIAIGDMLAIVTSSNCAMVQELSDFIAENADGIYYTVGIALEDVAVSGLVVNTPVKCRRTTGQATVAAGRIVYTAGETYDHKGSYSLNDQTDIDQNARGTVLEFNGTTSVGTNADLTQISGSLGFMQFSFRYKATGVTQTLFSTADTAGTTKYLYCGIEASGVLVLSQRNGDTADTILGSTVLTDGQEYIAVFRSTGTAYEFDLGGIAETLVISSGANTGDWFTETEDRDIWALGALVRSSSALFFASTLGKVIIGNLIPTEAQRLQMLSGNIPPELQYGSQVSIVTGDDSDFDTIGNWTPFSAAATVASVAGGVSGNCLEVTRVSGATQTGALANILTTEIGQEYYYEAYVKSGTSGDEAYQMGIVTSAGGAWELLIEGTSSSTWTKVSGTFIASVVDPDAWCLKNSATAGTMLFDSVILKPVGAVWHGDNTSMSSTFYYDLSGHDNHAALTSVEVLNKPGVTPLACLRSSALRIAPGATPNTNIDVTDNSSAATSFNAPALTSGTDIAKSGSSGSFALSADGTAITITTTETIVGIMPAQIITHNINNSSTTELYTLNPVITAGQLVLRIKKRGANDLVDWTTIMDANDRVDLILAFITATG